MQGLFFYKGKQMSNSNEEKMHDSGKADFYVGGKVLQLKFLAATRFRLFINIQPSEVQDYVSSEAFKLRSVALLLLGKTGMDMRVDEILDRFDELGLTDEECQNIYEWVLQRTINFMIQEAEAQNRVIQKGMPQVEQLSNSLNGLKL